MVHDLRRDHDVVSIDLIPGETTGIIGSINDARTVTQAMESCDAVLHTASLHAPHVGVRSRGEFLHTNFEGTLSLLEAAERENVHRFVYSSTTSLYGAAMESDSEAVWVTEDLEPSPRDIYDTTKIAAEKACRDAAHSSSMTAISLRISRYFPETANLVAVYRLYRGVDLRDVVAAHRLALYTTIDSYDVFNISARSPFNRSERKELFADAKSVILRIYPEAETSFASRGWSLPSRIDRVYDISKAERTLGYTPRHDFAELLAPAGPGHP